MQIFWQPRGMAAGDVLNGVLGEDSTTRHAGSSYATPCEVERSTFYGSTSADHVGGGGKRRQMLVAGGIAAAVLLCAVAGVWDVAVRGGRSAAADADELLGSTPGAAEMSAVAWKALHKQFQREDAELQAQLNIAQLPALKDIRSGVSGPVMSTALGDTSAAGLSSVSSSTRKGEAQLRILKRYGERGQSLDNSMGFSGNAGPYSALLQTSAVVGDAARGESTAEGAMSMLLETGGGGGTDYADAMSENGLAANDPRWPSPTARSAEQSLAQSAAQAAEKLMKSEQVAAATARAQRKEQKAKFLHVMARERKQASNELQECTNGFCVHTPQHAWNGLVDLTPRVSATECVCMVCVCVCVCVCAGARQGDGGGAGVEERTHAAGAGA